MEEDGLRERETIQKFAQNTTAWIGIGGALFGVLSFCMLLGMWFGPLRELPAQVSPILAQLVDIKTKIAEVSWQLDALKTKTDTTNVQLSTTSGEQIKLREDVRKLELTVTQLVATTVLKVDFVEWKAQLEKQNTNLDAPPLRTSKP